MSGRNPRPTHELVINPGHNPIIPDELLCFVGEKERHKGPPAVTEETIRQSGHMWSEERTGTHFKTRNVKLCVICIIITKDLFF